MEMGREIEIESKMKMWYATEIRRDRRSTNVLCNAISGRAEVGSTQVRIWLQ
jgi:hypothetical protein